MQTMRCCPLSIYLSRMTQTVISVGIDVSKAKVDVAWLLPDQSVQVQLFSNTPQGMEALIQVLNQNGTGSAVPCVVESTGDYHLLCAVMLSNAGYQVNVINPLITKQYQQGSIRQAKSDRVDAKRLAKIGLLEPNLPVFTSTTDTIMAKKLVSLLAQLEKTYQRLQACAKQFLATQEQLQCSVLDDAVLDMALQAVQRVITTIQRTVVQLAPATTHDLARTIPGVSTTSLAILLCGLTDKQFTHRDQLVAFVGLDVRARRSGTWQGKERLSKRGNAFLRKVLYQMAWGLKMHHPAYQQYYQRLYHEEGKHYTTTLIAIARKFLRYLFAVYFQPRACPRPV
jgi:transposase